MESAATNSAMYNRLDQIKEITRLYAMYSRRLGGLGNVIGGSLALIAYLINGLIELEWWSRIVLALTPILWIAIKEILRTTLYQQYGQVTEDIQTWEKRLHQFLTAFTGVVTFGILSVVTYKTWTRPDFITINLTQIIGYTGFVFALPFLTWFYFKNPFEFIVGVFLISQAAVVLGGGNYTLTNVLWVPLIAVIIIIVGIVEHIKFRKIEVKLHTVQKEVDDERDI